MDPCETHVLGHLLLSNLTSLGDLVKMQILVVVSQIHHPSKADVALGCDQLVDIGFQ